LVFVFLGFFLSVLRAELRASRLYFCSLKECHLAGRSWLTPVILATQEGSDQEDRGLKPAQANSSARPYLKKKKKKNLHKNGGWWSEWLKVKAPISSPRTKKKKTKKRHLNHGLSWDFFVVVVCFLFL
jgi:hypothetical protein